MEKAYELGKTFGVGNPNGITVPGYAERHPCVPAEKSYYFNARHLADTLAWWNGYGSKNFDEGLFYYGPTGSGKTSFFRQFAARLNIPVHSITGHGAMEVQDMLGDRTLLDGDIIWQDGALTQAFRDGHVFMVNEVDAIRPDVLVGLNSILEDSELVLTQNGGQVVERHPNFRAVFTANTAGDGDVSGSYQGTLRMNAAFRDRNVFDYMDYLEPEEERKVLDSVCQDIEKDVRDSLCDKMIKAANDVRTVYKGAGTGPQLDVPFSTRALIRWMRMTWYYRALSKQKGDPVHYALDRALANSTNEVNRKALHEIVQRVMGS